MTRSRLSGAVFSFLTILGLLGTQGCRNQVDLVTETSTEYRRTEQATAYRVKVSETEPANAFVSFQVDKQLKTSVDIIHIDQTFERYTPYNGWLELYEVPTGLVLLPVALTTHVFSVFTFGMFPFRWAVGLTNFSFACMNPALNAEAEFRSVTEAWEPVERHLDTTLEEKALPAENLSLTLKGESRSWRLTTNEKGEAEFQFLDFTTGASVLNPNDREIAVYAGESLEPAVKLIISRSLMQRLDQAGRILRSYRANPTGENLTASIAQLEEIHFVKLAYLLEKSELEANRNNPEFLKSFERK